MAVAAKRPVLGLDRDVHMGFDPQDNVQHKAVGLDWI
jgi:hypothetical protein